MNLTTEELIIIKRLLENRLNASYDSTIADLYNKVEKEINER